MADDIAAAGLIVKHPIHKTAAIQSVGAVSSGGGAACRSDLPHFAPSGVPADHEALYSDR